MGLHSITLLGPFHGSWSLSEWDVIPLRNEERFRSVLRRVPFDLEIIAQYPLRPEDRSVTATPGRVTFKALANGGSDLLPLTPWIVIHRLFHAIDLGKDNEWFSQYRPTLTAIYSEIMRELGFKTHVMGLLGYHADHVDRDNFISIISSIATMRSARTKGFTTSLDFDAEFFAQYCIGGGVKLRQPDGLPEIDLVKHETAFNEVFGQICRDLVGRAVRF